MFGKQQSGFTAFLTNPVVLVIMFYFVITSAMKLKRLEDVSLDMLR
jgi:hypothetical protein